ncbi:WGR domain-containing protein [Stackebrandtia nassauensis]|uniref:WGR domain protein n=1 Tax=Stackebrandtia nassauensis (strain DSM 44728 / CIP 108903 / NRRL B-16338 / NBRC 102104 / LLR-40K-21) TaxID=446470 RepID=D3Q0M9_STANL|nr:WGR domain-containing protein [Stackebrandtia nassauensis]ADD41765.1 WGR domain protein [Stackebrandtia nassauensis DSM 44728]
MTEEHTYLELSEDNGTAHKYYEVTISGTTVTISYGRIGTAGQERVSTFPTLEKARAAAEKKLNEKLRKGYAPAQRGVRQARPVSRRTIVSSRSTAKQAPVLWRFDSGAAAFGIYVDDDRCMVGNQRGDIFKVTHSGEVVGHFSLPDGVKCLVADDFWLYAGCDDGRVYDLSGKIPRVAYEISADVDIFWLDVDDATLGVSDRNGRITAIDHEDEFQWARDVTGNDAWMVRCDADAVYHGHSRGVARYDTGDGTPRWESNVNGNVLFGWQERDSVYAGTGRGEVYRLAKADGAVEARYRCDSAVYSCATSPQGRFVFAGDDESSIYCFDENGERLWKLGTGCGSAFSMQFHGDRLYIVTTSGALACLDASPAAIEAAQAGQLPTATTVKAPPTLAAVAPSVELETVTYDGDGVIVECFRDGAKLRVRAVSDGFEASWNVQFPKDIRQPGARYVVDGLRASERGGFYRSYGEIRRLR